MARVKSTISKMRKWHQHYHAHKYNLYACCCRWQNINDRMPLEIESERASKREKERRCHFSVSPHQSYSSGIQYWAWKNVHIFSACIEIWLEWNWHKYKYSIPITYYHACRHSSTYTFTYCYCSSLSYIFQLISDLFSYTTLFPTYSFFYDEIT